MECRKLLHPLTSVCLGNNRISSTDTLGLVPGDLHGDRPGDSGPFLSYGRRFVGSHAEFVRPPRLHRKRSFPRRFRRSALAQRAHQALGISEPETINRSIAFLAARHSVFWVRSTRLRFDSQSGLKPCLNRHQRLALCESN